MMIRRITRREVGRLVFLTSVSKESGHGKLNTVPLFNQPSTSQIGQSSGQAFCIVPSKCSFSDLSRKNFSSDASTHEDAPPLSDGVLAFRKVVQICEVLDVDAWTEGVAKRLNGMEISYTSDLVVRVVRALSSPGVALNFFNWLTIKGFEQDAHTYGAIIDVLGASGSLEKMKYLADEMRKSAIPLDYKVYEILLRWSVENGDSEGASLLLDQMKEDGIAMTALTYTNMFNLYIKEGKYDDAVTLYLQMIEEGVLPVPETVTSLVRCLLDAGKLDAAHTIFTSLSSIKVKPPMSAYAYLMGAYAAVNNSESLQRLGKKMRNAYSRPGSVFCTTFRSLLKQGKPDEANAFAKEVWPNLSKEALQHKAQDTTSIPALDEDKDGIVQNDLGKLMNSKVRMSLSEVATLLETEGISVAEHLKMEWTSDAVYKVLQQIHQPDVAWDFFKWLKSVQAFEHDFNNEVWMMRSLIKASNFGSLTELLTDLQTRKVSIPLEVFNTLIYDCALVKSTESALWVYSRIKESNLQPDEETFNFLVQAFARGRNPDRASDLCAVMQDLGIKPDVETYTAVIHSLGLAGRSDDAWSVYQKMLAAGLKPNSHTYTALLNMMNLVGDTGFAIKLYKEMSASGIAPTEATQGIMSKILEASGNTAEAEKVDTQRRFLSSKRKEDTLQRVYEALLEGLVEEERSPSLLAFA